MKKEALRILRSVNPKTGMEKAFAVVIIATLAWLVFHFYINPNPMTVVIAMCVIGAYAGVMMSRNTTEQPIKDLH